MILFTAQHPAVIEILGRGETYWPDWAHARPFDDATATVPGKGNFAVGPVDLETVRPQRQAAYRWMAASYARLKGRSESRHVVYAFLDRATVEEIMEVSDVLLKLDVPDDEALVSQHTPWSTEVLVGARVSRRNRDLATGDPSAIFTPEQSWDTIFEVQGYDGPLQVVFDRIEPEWVTAGLTPAR